MTRELGVLLLGQRPSRLMDLSLPIEAVLMATIDFLVLCDAMNTVPLRDGEVNSKLYDSSVILS